MSQTERIYKIERLLKNLRFVPGQRFLRDVGVSSATFKRDLQLLRDRLNAPIPYDRAQGGYRLGTPAGGEPRQELPRRQYEVSKFEFRTPLPPVTCRDALRSRETGVGSDHAGKG